MGSDVLLGHTDEGHRQPVHLRYDHRTAHVAILGTTAVTSGPFVMLEFPINGVGMPTEPTTVYVEGPAGALYLDKPHEVERYERAFDHIKSASLSEAASRKFIADAVKEWRK